MAKRFFGPRNLEVIALLEQLRQLDAGQSRAIAGAVARSGITAPANARRRALSTARAQARAPFWSAARAYGSAAAEHAAYKSEKVHYSAIRPGSVPWGLVREACRDAAGVAAIADVLDRGEAQVLAGPILAVRPELRRLILGHD